MDTETLDEEILLRLIDKIVVEEPLKQGRQRTYRVQIVYNYVGGLALLPGEKAVAHG